MDLVHQLDARTRVPCLGSPLVVVVQPAHDRKGNHLVARILRRRNRSAPFRNLLLDALMRPLYWLLGSSVRERGPLDFHCSHLSGCQVGLSQRNCRGRVLIYQRNHACLGSGSGGQACKGSRRGLPQTSSAMSYQQDGPCLSAGYSYMWFRFRPPSSSHGAVHP